MYRSYGNCNTIIIPPPIKCAQVNVTCEEKEYPSVFSPSVWGESLWFLFHVGSLAANEQISASDAKKYWNFIEGIPIMLPCNMCSEHAQKFIDNNRSAQETICKSREDLIEFFVKFHNYVNIRQGKPLITKDDIKQLGRGNVRMSVIKYF